MNPKYIENIWTNLFYPRDLYFLARLENGESLFDFKQKTSSKIEEVGLLLF